MNIQEKLKSIIIEVASCGLNPDDINENTNLIRDLNMDSIKIMELVVEIETKYNIEIDDDNLNINILSNFQRLYDMVTEKIQQV